MATTFSYLLGRDAEAYFHAGGLLINDATLGSPATPKDAVDLWLNDVNGGAIVDNVMTLNLNLGSEFADATTRGTAKSGFASSIPVLKNGEVTFDMRWLPNAIAGSFTEILLTAWENFGRIGLCILDFNRKYNPGQGNTFTVQGLAANFSVSLDKSEDLRDVQKASVTLTIADSGLWYKDTITGS